jgi:Uma2 family endonuclease
MDTELSGFTPVSPPAEQRMLIHGVSWKEYVILREALDTPGLRMTYCEGALELMSPSRKHELWKKTIARLVEAYAYEKRLRLNGYGSTTFRNEAAERGAEPDECYRVGSIMREGEVPDIALEVMHLSPLLDKLHVYSGLEVPEVWLFKEGAFQLFRLEGDKYHRIERSAFLPDLDFALIARLATTHEDQQDALDALREALRAR